MLDAQLYGGAAGSSFRADHSRDSSGKRRKRQLRSLRVGPWAAGRWHGRDVGSGAGPAHRSDQLRDPASHPEGTGSRRGAQQVQARDWASSTRRRPDDRDTTPPGPEGNIPLSALTGDRAVNLFDGITTEVPCLARPESSGSSPRTSCNDADANLGRGRPHSHTPWPSCSTTSHHATSATTNPTPGGRLHLIRAGSVDGLVPANPASAPADRVALSCSHCLCGRTWRGRPSCSGPTVTQTR